MFFFYVIAFFLKINDVWSKMGYFCPTNGLPWIKKWTDSYSCTALVMIWQIIISWQPANNIPSLYLSSTITKYELILYSIAPLNKGNLLFYNLYVAAFIVFGLENKSPNHMQVHTVALRASWHWRKQRWKRVFKKCKKCVFVATAWASGR